MEFLINFLKLTRPLSNIKNIALVLVAFYLFGEKKELLPIILGIISLSFVSSAVYAQNSFYDYNADKNNKNKQHYRKAVEYFGKKNTIIIIAFLVSVGFIIGFFINVYFLITLFFLFLTGFFYSSENFRFKERIILDILFGAVFTFFLRFLAAWFIFSGYPLGRLPPLFAISALVFAKTGGYLLYKEADRAFLEKLNIKNSVTSLKKKTVILLSALCQIVAIFSFIFMCLNSVFFKLNFLGILPIKFLFLIIFTVPPLMIIYLSALEKIKTKIKNLRILGFAYWALVIVVTILFF